MKKPEYIRDAEDHICPSGKRIKKAYFLCACGKEFITTPRHVITGNTRSCGCLHKKEMIDRQTKHGLATHPLYKIWHNMMSRCYYKKNRSYRWYGAEGVRVCHRWHKFENFYADMFPSYESGLSLDRTNGSKIYSKLKCRWATQLQQARNKRSNVFVTHMGETKCLAEWSRTLFGSPNIVAARLSIGWTIEKALTTPKETKKLANHAR